MNWLKKWLAAETNLSVIRKLVFLLLTETLTLVLILTTAILGIVFLKYAEYFLGITFLVFAIVFLIYIPKSLLRDARGL